MRSFGGYLLFQLPEWLILPLFLWLLDENSGELFARLGFLVLSRSRQRQA
jgi:hypothetical protein